MHDESPHFLFVLREVALHAGKVALYMCKGIFLLTKSSYRSLVCAYYSTYIPFFSPMCYP